VLDQHDGIGFEFSPLDPFVGVDLDGCVIDGQVQPWAQTIIDSFMSYTEFSPSGTGVHIIVRGEKPGPRCRKGTIEMYEEGRYLTMTGLRVPDTPPFIADCQRQLVWLYNDLFPEKHEPPPRPMGPATRCSIDDEDLLERIRKSRSGGDFDRLWAGHWKGAYPSQSEADMALACMLAFWTGRDPQRMDTLFRRSGLMRDKWDREDYRARTLDGAIATTKDTYRPGRNGSGGPPEMPPHPADCCEDAPAPGDDQDAAAYEPSEPPPVVPATDVTQGVPYISVAELLQREIPPASWLVEPLLPDVGVAMMAGDSGVGKSWLAYHLALSVGAGVPFLGRFLTIRKPTLVIDLENGEARAQLRMRKLVQGMKVDPLDLDLTFIQVGRRLPIDRPEVAARFASQVKELGPGLVIIDSLRRVYSGDENDSATSAKIGEALKVVAETAGCLVLAIHHLRKASSERPNDPGERLRGSSDWRAVMDAIFVVTRRRKDAISLYHTKCRDAEEQEEFLVELKLGEVDEPAIIRHLGDLAEDKIGRAKELVLEMLAGGPTPKPDITGMSDEWDIGERTIIRALQELEAEETIISHQPSRRQPKTYHLPGQLTGGLEL
jgi:hypothetical protein